MLSFCFIMNTEDRTDINELCSGEDPAFCMSACPIDWDIRSFVTKIREGNFDGAFQDYRKAVYFPEVICRVCDAPCEKKCVLTEKAEPVSLRNLERAVCEYAKKKEPPRFFVPKKKKTAAVIGAGLAGAGCACKLAKKGYTVDLYDERAGAGGCLYDMDDSALAGILDHEIGKYLQANKVLCHFNQHIDDLDSITADAIYIATGQNGSRFGLDDGWDSDTLETRRSGIFLSNNTRTDAPLLTALYEGLQMADALDSYLKINRVTGRLGEYKPKDTRLFLKPDGTRCGPVVPEDVKPAVKPAAGSCYSEEEAALEADRCLLCSCDNCINSCELLRRWNSPPKRIVNDIKMTVTSIPDLTVHAATRKLASCNLCGLCRDECPAGVDFEKIFFEGRRALHQRGELPPAFHDFWMRDMAFSESDEFSCILPADGTCGYCFFPGCQLAGSDPDYVTAGYDYLRNVLDDSVGIMLGCCGAPAYYAAKDDDYQEICRRIYEKWEQMGRPVMITACLSCDKILEERLPDMKRRSVYSIIAEHGIRAGVKADGRKVSIFDPCASRGEAGIQDDIRRIMGAAGFEISELPHSGGRARCCGNGGHVYSADPDLVDENIRQCISESPEDYAVYCANCRELFAHAGKPVMHVLDLLLDEPVENRIARPAVSLSDSRDNRRKLRQILIEQYGNDKMNKTKKKETKDIIITYTDEILAKMDRELITRDDVEEVIRHCEETNRKVLDMEAGYYIGYKKIGEITLWVIYMPVDDGSFNAMGVYTHRMSVGEA